MIVKKYKKYRIYSRMPIHIHKKLNILRNFKTKEDIFQHLCFALKWLNDKILFAKKNTLCIDNGFSFLETYTFGSLKLGGQIEIDILAIACGWFNFSVL